MRLPEQVLVYGDCAVNPDPDAETLADIAIQSADSAERFGIPARVAMISYSTGSRGLERMLTKREATRLAKTKTTRFAPRWAAVATRRRWLMSPQPAPDSPVGRHATIFVFPT